MADDYDEDEITIDHLIGIPCIYNRSVEVELRRNARKNRLELFSDSIGWCVVVEKVTALVVNGSYIVTLRKPDGTLVSEKAEIIKKSLLVT